MGMREIAIKVLWSVVEFLIVMLILINWGSELPYNLVISLFLLIVFFNFAAVSVRWKHKES